MCRASLHNRAQPMARAFMVALLILIGGCGNDPLSPEQQAMDAALSTWTRTRPASNSYVMEQQVACFCPYGGTTFEVTVEGGTITKARSVGTGALVEPSLSAFRTVDQLFSEARASLKAGTLLAISFDSAIGFPTVVSIDPIRNAVDDEVSYQTKKVTLR